MDETQQQLKTALENLPEKLQQFVRSGEWRTILNTVLQKYSLAEEQTKKLADEVLLSLLGITDPDDLPVAFQTTAELPAEQAEELALEIEGAVFEPVNEQLAELNPLSLDDYRAGLPQIQTALAKLPPALREIVVSTNTVDQLQAIGEKHHLHIDQMGALDEEVVNVLVGEAPASQFLQRLPDRLKVDFDTAAAITKEVNQEIFLKVREALHQLTVNRDQGNNLPTQEEILREIENPAPLIPPAPEEEKKTVFEQKMGGVFPQAPPPPAAEPKIKDPYLEPVE